MFNVSVNMNFVSLFMFNGMSHELLG